MAKVCLDLYSIFYSWVILSNLRIYDRFSHLFCKLVSKDAQILKDEIANASGEFSNAVLSVYKISLINKKFLYASSNFTTPRWLWLNPLLLFKVGKSKETVPYCNHFRKTKNLGELMVSLSYRRNPRRWYKCFSGRD